MEKGAKSKKELKDEKLKDQKLEEQILNELSGGSREEQFDTLLAKHIESESSNRRLKQDLKAQEKRLETILREKENLQREFNKSVLMRDKLQEVCREQQKIIKSMKNENMAKLREEEERRKENQIKFQTSLNEIHQSLSKNNEENLKLRDHNIEMTKKLKFLAEQYQAREQQLEKLNEQISLESQLQQAKLSKVQVQSEIEKEILLKRLSQTQTTLKDLTEREQALKEQLNWYTSKYDDFQSSLQKSNDIFATYKVEMEKLSKNTRKIEKELLDWKRKYEKSNATVIQLATEKKDRDDHSARCSKQVDQLQKLLRALQHERTHLYKVLRENNVECPTLPELPPEPEPLKIPTEVTDKEDKDKMEAMSKNCAEIKQTLASLQSQIKTLKLKETEANSLVKVENSATAMKQQQQQEEALKKQQKKKKQKSKNKNKDSASASQSAATTSTSVETKDVVGSETTSEKEINLEEETPSEKEINLEEETPSEKEVNLEEEITSKKEINLEENCTETKTENESETQAENSITPAVNEIIESNGAAAETTAADVKSTARENESSDLSSAKEVSEDFAEDPVKELENLAGEAAVEAASDSPNIDSIQQPAPITAETGVAN